MGDRPEPDRATSTSGGYYSIEYNTQLRFENAAMRKALEWYEKIVGECNRHGREGDDAREALASDLGQRAAAALVDFSEPGVAE